MDVDKRTLQQNSQTSDVEEKRPQPVSRGVQLRAQLRGRSYQEQVAMLAPVQTTGGAPRGDIQSIAASGLKGAAQPLPHGDAIQKSFGRFDVSGIQAHVGGPAAGANRAMGAEAYASGESVAFRSNPSLHTAAHEAAHVVQQRAGVQLAGGVGKVGDRYEQHADSVANLVVKGESAEAVLSEMAGPRHDGQATQAKAVQRLNRPDLAAGERPADIPANAWNGNDGYRQRYNARNARVKAMGSATVAVGAAAGLAVGDYLYHMTSKESAVAIKASGLQPKKREWGGRDPSRDGFLSFARDSGNANGGGAGWDRIMLRIQLTAADLADESEADDGSQHAFKDVGGRLTEVLCTKTFLPNRLRWRWVNPAQARNHHVLDGNNIWRLMQNLPSGE